MKLSYHLFIAVAIGSLLYWLLVGYAQVYGVPPEKVRGKRVVITGASYGIGKSIAIEYAKLGASQLVLAARSTDKLNAVKEEIFNLYSKDVKIFIVSVDISTEAACKEVIDRSIESMGGIDYLILNHITSSRFGLWLTDNANLPTGHSFLKEMFAVNTFSYIWLATQAMEALKQSSGQIVVVSSLAGHVGTPKTAAYSSTKHALHGFFNALRVELDILGISNVGITICAIGATDTEGAKEVKEKLSSVSWDSPRDAALAIIAGAAGRKREIFHPHHLVFPSIIIHNLIPSVIDYSLKLVTGSS